MSNERNKLLQKVLSMTTYTYERFKDQTEEWFTDYEDYVRFNRQVVNGLDDNEVDRYLSVALLVERGSIDMVDEEHYNPWTATSCFFDISGQFVIMHPR